MDTNAILTTNNVVLPNNTIGPIGTSQAFSLLFGNATLTRQDIELSTDSQLTKSAYVFDKIRLKIHSKELSQRMKEKNPLFMSSSA